MVIVHIIFFVLSIILLVESSDFFIEAIARLAKRLGVSEFFIGLTLVALGTSLPELVNSVYSAMQGHSSIVMGNVIGSNITNVCLVLGIAALVAKIKVTETLFKRDGYILLFACLVFFVFVMIGILPQYRGDFLISPTEGIFLLLFFIIYVLFLFEERVFEEKKYHFKEFLKYFIKFEYITTIRRNIFRIGREKIKGKIPYLERESLIKDCLVLLVTAVGIYYGAMYLLKEIIWFARFFHVQESFIALTIVAIGTSLPDLSVCISAAKKGLGGIAIGTIIGANIAKILLVVGIASFFRPISVSIMMVYFAIPVMIITTFIMLLLISRKLELGRREGIALLLFYGVFLIFAYLLQPMF